MNYGEKAAACKEFFDRLAEALKEYGYTIVDSCNADSTIYLVISGTEKDISYYGKPILSFRLSDHWNWYSNMSKCDKYWFVQCKNDDITWPTKRTGYGATKPKYAWQVAIFGADKKYHCVFGEKFDRRTKKWSFVTPTVEEVIESWIGWIIHNVNSGRDILEKVKEMEQE